MAKEKVRFLFVVQGEGRGHMTQAISLKQILAGKGHDICAVYVGKSRSRSVPKFFTDRMAVPVFTFESPNFRTDLARRGVSIVGTALENFIRLPVFARGVLTLHRAVSVHKPDVVVNFFDPLAAIYGLFCFFKPKMVCLAHQYLALHPAFPFPEMNRLAKLGMLSFIKLCALGAERRLALSFRHLPDLPAHKLFVVPPLLRNEIRSMVPVTEDFILAYVLNDGYANDLAAKQRRRPEVRILGFWDRKGVQEVTQLQENVVFHRLDDVAFVDAMRRCRGFMSTAGFESICESMYLGKPVYMMPANRQIEQHCNAIDASLSGAGIWGFEFDLEGFLDYLPRHNSKVEDFRAWVDRAEEKYVDFLVS